MDGNGGSKDHDKLTRICPDMDIGSQECEALWEKQLYTIRWGRIGRLVDSIQYEQPIE